MAQSSHPMAGPRAIPENDAPKIVAACRECIEEEAKRLGRCPRYQILAIQRAMEATRGHPGGFRFAEIRDQIHEIANGAETWAPAAETAARRADSNPTDGTSDSFFNSYIARVTKGKERRFNSYVREACKRLGLGYIAVIGGSPGGDYSYCYLKYARSETEPDEPIQDVERLTAMIDQSASLLAKRGWGAVEVGQAYRNARAVGEALTAPDYAAIDRLRFEIAIGLCSHNLVRGELAAANAEAARLRDIAKRGDDLSMRVVALRGAGTTALWFGRFADAERDLRKCLEELGDGFNYRPFPSDMGESPFSLVASDLAAALVVLGRHKEALDANQEARKMLVGKNAPYHDCYSLMFSSWIKLELGQLANAAKDASSLLRQASRHGFAALRGLGMAFDGIIRAFRSDDPTDGVSDVFRGLGEWQGAGSALFVSCLCTAAAKVWLRAGSARQAEPRLKEAFEFAKNTGDGFYIAEMHRLRGDIQWMCNKNFAAAETELRKALEITESQESRMYRLRTAMSLLQLALQRDDFDAELRFEAIAKQAKFLAEVYALFKHEPPSADLKIARTLIASASKLRLPAQPAGRKGRRLPK